VPNENPVAKQLAINITGSVCFLLICDACTGLSPPTVTCWPYCSCAPFPKHLENTIISITNVNTATSPPSHHLLPAQARDEADVREREVKRLTAELKRAESSRASEVEAAKAELEAALAKQVGGGWDDAIALLHTLEYGHVCVCPLYLPFPGLLLAIGL
jgi:hypothetical protein